MKLAIVKASTNVTVYLFIQDSSATDGSGLTGLVYNSSGLVCYYVRPLAAAAALSLATQTVTGAHSDGGFVEVDATNMPGLYRLDLSDAICATGVDSVVVMLKGATDMAPVLLEIQLTDLDLNDGVRAGLTALPNAAADAAGGLPISDAGGLDLDTLDSNVSAILADTGTDGVVLANDSITAAKIAADAIGASELAADAAAEIADAVLDEALSGHTTAGTLGKAIADTESDVSAILDDTDADGVAIADGGITAVKIASNAITADKIATGAITADKLAADAITAAKIAADAIGASELAADAVNEIADQVWTEAIGDHSGTSGSTAEALDGASAPTAAAVADAVWTETLADHSGVRGSTAEGLDAAGGGATVGAIADAVWDEATSGHATSGSFGEKVNAIPTPQSGSIEYTYTIDDGSNPIDGAEVWISTDSGGNNVIWFGHTDANGIAKDSADVKPFLDAGTYYGWVQKAGYTFTNPDTLTVS